MRRTTAITQNIKVPAVNKRQKLHFYRKRLYQDRYLYLLVLPMLLWFFLFKYLPMYGVTVAFKDYNILKGVWNSPWAGLKYFRLFLTGPFFGRVFRNTLLLNIYSLAFSFPAPIILAIMLNEVRNARYKKFVQTATYLPHFISTVVICGLIIEFLAPSDGLVNIILDKLGFEKIYFIMEKKWFRPIYIGSGIWQHAGFSSIVYLAAITSIDPHLYEAATIDGANKWHKIKYVTLPGIMPTIATLLILRLGDLLDSGYEKIILLYQPTTYEVADTIGSYVYRIGLVDSNYSLAAAVGLFQGVIALILVLIANNASKRLSEYSLW